MIYDTFFFTIYCRNSRIAQKVGLHIIRPYICEYYCNPIYTKHSFVSAVYKLETVEKAIIMLRKGLVQVCGCRKENCQFVKWSYMHIQISDFGQKWVTNGSFPSVKKTEKKSTTALPKHDIHI